MNGKTAFRISDSTRVKRRSAISMAATNSRRWKQAAGIWGLVAMGLCLAGCSFLKPAHGTARRFLLTPLPSSAMPTTNGGTRPPLSVGVGQVKMPAYLLDSSIAVRKGTNEIDYLTTALWAEQLDNGFQRVLAANLSVLLPTDRIRLTAWRPEDVSVEVYASVEQFDVNTEGSGVLIAWWRIRSAGGDKTFKSGETRLVRQGPTPAADLPGATATLSELVAEMSRQLAQAINETVPIVR